MVKGVTRRVIVVKTPDPRYFEEAIFIVKEDVNLAGVDAEGLLKEAKSVASGYVKNQTCRQGIFRRIPPLAYLLAGAALTAVCMTLAGLLF